MVGMLGVILGGMVVVLMTAPFDDNESNNTERILQLDPVSDGTNGETNGEPCRGALRDWEVANYTAEETGGWRGLGVRGLEAGTLVSGDLRRLMRVVRKAEEGKPITMVGLGSSVMARYGGSWVDQATDPSPDVAAYVKWRLAENVPLRTEKGEGWAKSALDLFQASWPHPHHRLINAGFDATSVGDGPCGCWSMVQMPSSIDLVILEWATIMNEDEVSEGCLRFLLDDQDAAVIAVSNDFEEQRSVIKLSASLASLARHYNVPTVSTSGWHHSEEVFSVRDLYEFNGDERTPHPTKGLGNTHIGYWVFHPIARAAAEVARLPRSAPLPPPSALPPPLFPKMVPVHVGPCFHARAYQLIPEGTEVNQGVNLHDLVPTVFLSFSSKLVQWRGPFSWKWKKGMSFVDPSSSIDLGLLWPPESPRGDLVLSFVHSWSPTYGSVRVSCPPASNSVCTCPDVDQDFHKGTATTSGRVTVPLTYVSPTSSNQPSNRCVVLISRTSPPRCKEQGWQCGQRVFLESVWVDFATE